MKFMILMITWAINSTLVFVDPEIDQEQIVKYVNAVSEDYDLDPALIEAMIKMESDYDPEAVSSCGAKGLMQIIETYHADRMDRLGVEDLLDPYGNILTGADYMAELIDKYGNQKKALMVYNMGNRGADLYDQGIVSAYAKNVIAYASKIRRLKDGRGIDSKQSRIDHLQF